MNFAGLIVMIMTKRQMIGEYERDDKSMNVMMRRMNMVMMIESMWRWWINDYDGDDDELMNLVVVAKLGRGEVHR